MADNSLVPVPYNVPMLNQKGLLTMPWGGWFRQVYNALTGNGTPDPAPTVCPPGLIAENGASGTPLGWLDCNGTSYVCSVHPDLAVALWDGAAFKWGGSGSPASGSFNVPNLPGAVHGGVTLNKMIKT